MKTKHGFKNHPESSSCPPEGKTGWGAAEAGARPREPHGHFQGGFSGETRPCQTAEHTVQVAQVGKGDFIGRIPKGPESFPLSP